MQCLLFLPASVLKSPPWVSLSRNTERLGLCFPFLGRQESLVLSRSVINLKYSFFFFSSFFYNYGNERANKTGVALVFKLEPFVVVFAFFIFFFF